MYQYQKYSRVLKYTNIKPQTPSVIKEIKKSKSKYTHVPNKIYERLIQKKSFV